ncbi:lipid II:glycine glycyltransferase FemX [Kribbella flavida]|uniref:lipid II:glycine glycyltransferase FemX n=1 Tax=Kribbella flavida TaxID=182640 RepID=UPI00019BE334|nr:peptidoglycan bridge formation glycyltransferase FemA/FemB family protein [Kribbella flavida]
MPTATLSPLRQAQLTVSPVDRAQYLSASDLYGGRSFLQAPSWAQVKAEWRSELLAWRDADQQIVGTALVLYRSVPRLRRSFAYLPEGPDIDWSEPSLDRWLTPLVDHLAAGGAFAVRIGPPPALRRWRAGTLKAAAGPSLRIGHVLPDLVEPMGSSVSDRLRTLGWRRCGEDGAGGDAQPRFVFQVPLQGRSLDELRSGLSSEWRRNLNKSVRSGVETRMGTEADLPTFHHLLGVTEQRNGFRLGRSLPYYQRQYRALNAEADGRMRLYLASYQGEVLAAHTMNVVGRRVWYQCGASANHRRDVRPSHALQWRMMEDAHRLGAAYYDMRGISDCLDPGRREFGLLRWKLGTGGEVVETLGEWELTLPGVVNQTLHHAMQRYRNR